MTTTAPKEFTTFFSRLSVAALLVNERGEIVEANAAVAELHGAKESRELDGLGWPGLDARLNLIQWKKRWRQIEVGESLTYDTDLLTAGELLRPVVVEAVKLNPELMLLRLEDQLIRYSAAQQLEQLSQAAQAGYFFYNFIDQKLELSAVARELLGLTDDKTDVDDIVEHLKASTNASDRERARRRFKELIAEEGQFSESIHIELLAGTKSLMVTGRSVANELHVTHLLGMVREIRSSTTAMNDGSIPEELARFSIDEARDMIFWTRPDGNMAFVNQSAADYLGYDRKTLEGKQVRFISPDFTDSEREEFWKRLRQEKAFELEYDLVTKSRKVLRISGATNYLRFGDEEYACSFCRDITEKQATEQKRVLAENTINKAREYILYVDRGGRVLYVNQTLLDRTNLDRSHVEQSHVEGLLEFGEEKDYENIWSTLSAELRYHGEMRLRLGEESQGKNIPVFARVDMVDDGTSVYSCFYLTDWSNKKNRDAIIGLSGLALEQADEAIIWLEEDLSLRYLNAKVIQLVGGKQDSWVGKDVRELLPELREKTILEETSFEVRLETRAGQTIYFDFSRTELEQDGKRFYVLTGRDVTERLLAEKKLRTAYSEIQELKEKLQDENISLREEAEAQYSLDNIVTVSPKYRKVLHQISQVADVDTTVLITGETGTGKELLARAVHKLSDRVDEPLIKVNCAALPENLIESELFGHEKGAFTGANARKKGRFELAHRGTIFLDEIGELPLDLQSKLLRVLQEGEFERLGGTETVKVDVRLVAATNRNLAKMVSKRRFREDLYYRLNVFPIVNIPLRERPEDIEPLVKYFVGRFAKQQGKQITDISGTDLKKLKRYSFPGNIRELENLVERAVVLCNSEVLRIEIEHRQGVEKELGKPFLPFEEMQRQHIITALKKTGGRITGEEGAGRLLQLNDRTLMSKMRKLKIAKRDYIE